MKKWTVDEVIDIAVNRNYVMAELDNVRRGMKWYHSKGTKKLMKDKEAALINEFMKIDDKWLEMISNKRG